MASEAYAKCDACEKEMVPGGGCRFELIKIQNLEPSRCNCDGAKVGKLVERRRMEHGSGNCHDCNAGPGRLHHDGCDWERCPVCGGQMLGDEHVVSDEGYIEFASKVAADRL